MIDLRTDVMTRPTKAMWEAMRSCSLGWALAGEDESINMLQRVAAEMSGMEAALFVPTGTIGNLITLMSYGSRGDRIVLEEESHIACCEAGGYGAIAGVVPWTIKGDRGIPSLEQLETGITYGAFGRRPVTAAVCIESSHNLAGGTIIPTESIDSMGQLAAQHDVPLHLDGARVFNVVQALGVELKRYLANVTSVMINLNKGLSAPYGAVVCGPVAVIERCVANLKLVGGWSVNKAGMLAAAGITALQTMPMELKKDHLVARMLADGISAAMGDRVQVNQPETNIVVLNTEPVGLSADFLTEQLRALNILVHPIDSTSVRLVTHRHISVTEVDRAIDGFSAIANAW